jgi:hypothetical protein
MMSAVWLAARLLFQRRQMILSFLSLFAADKRFGKINRFAETLSTLTCGLLGVVCTPGGGGNCNTTDSHSLTHSLTHSFTHIGVDSLR